MTSTTKGTAKVTLPEDNQILVTREFNAPKALVWRAYNTPDLVKRWWAGDRGEVVSAEIDLRVGGGWRYVMIGAGGSEVAFRGEYREIAAPDRLVNTEIFEGLPDPDDHPSLITVTLNEQDGRTHFRMLCEYGNQADRDAVMESGMENGMQESFDHLEEVACKLDM
ncbi:SRPBCC family protein [Dactylosporangium sp. NPDC051485]|uniref:SRPBCC family protein n=1 Tax=Dactylosporangium sp. NPDC051485 TaxID=3154846 RepID=UPI00341A28CF